MLGIDGYLVDSYRLEAHNGPLKRLYVLLQVSTPGKQENDCNGQDDFGHGVVLARMAAAASWQDSA